jgi:hypothetical protein
METRLLESLSLGEGWSIVEHLFELCWRHVADAFEEAGVEELRGEISLDKGGNSKVESTKDWGTHYVACHVVKNGRVIAVDHQTAVVS